MKITNKTTVVEAMLILRDIDFLDQLDSVFCSVNIPEITYGQRIDMSNIKTWHDLLFIPQIIMKGLNDNEIMKLPFYDTYNFGMTVVKELERMYKRDEEAFKYTPTSEEVQAGYHQLNHGVFGTVDRIAQRLHINNHDDVFELPEKRVYAMLKIDFDNSMYQKRLNEISSKK